MGSPASEVDPYSTLQPRPTKPDTGSADTSDPGPPVTAAVLEGAVLGGTALEDAALEDAALEDAALEDTVLEPSLLLHAASSTVRATATATTGLLRLRDWFMARDGSGTLWPTGCGSASMPR